MNIDCMDGTEFEEWCAQFLLLLGYTHVEMTKKSGDQGVDILAYKDGLRYAIQCKRYVKPVGNKAIQEVIAGRLFYKCDKAAVMTNNYFTDGATQLALATGVELWDRHFLEVQARYLESVHTGQRVVDPVNATPMPHAEPFRPLYHNKKLMNFIQKSYFPPPRFVPGGKVKSPVLAAVLAFTLGFVGVHNFYLGRARGALQIFAIILSILFSLEYWNKWIWIATVSAVWVWSIIDGIIILAQKKNRL